MAIICRDCNSAMDPFDGECKCDEIRRAVPRASRMPDHLPSVDPAFLDAIREVPEDAAQEKEGLPDRLRKVGAI